MAIQIEYRIWFYSQGEKLLGKGRIELLEGIQKHGSISQAATDMKMSYRQAWQMVEEMNQRAGKPLVEKQLGGRKGGGAALTPHGTKAIETFHKVNQKINTFIQKELRNIKL